MIRARFDLSVTCVAMTLLCAGAASGGENWPGWRGPTRDNQSDSTGLPESWSESENVVWKTPLPCWAGSTPVIWGDRIFLTSPTSLEKSKEEGEIGRRLKSMPTKVSEPGGPDILLLCLNKNDGKVLWERKLSAGNRFYAKHNMASPSPVTNGREVFAVAGTGVIAAFDFEGKALWTRNIQEEYGEFGMYWGYASSPLLLKDRLIVQVLNGATNENPSYLLAIDIKTGKNLWKVERKTDAIAECPDAYTTPTLIGDRRKLIVVSGGDYVTAHEIGSGMEIWRAGGLNPDKQKAYRICGSPTVVEGLVIATSRERPIVAIRHGGKGDVTKKNTVWTYDGRKGPDVPSATTDGKYLYLIHDNGFATCLNVKTGEEVWGPERIESGPYSASPLCADGRIYITNEDCVTTVLAAGPTFKSLQVNRLDGGYTLSSFAVSGDRLYLRAGATIYCIGKTKE